MSIFFAQHFTHGYVECCMFTEFSLNNCWLRWRRSYFRHWREFLVLKDFIEKYFFLLKFSRLQSLTPKKYNKKPDLRQYFNIFLYLLTYAWNMRKTTRKFMALAMTSHRSLLMSFVICEQMLREVVSWLFAYCSIPAKEKPIYRVIVERPREYLPSKVKNKWKLGRAHVLILKYDWNTSILVIGNIEKACQ